MVFGTAGNTVPVHSSDVRVGVIFSHALVDLSEALGSSVSESRDNKLNEYYTRSELVPSTY